MSGSPSLPILWPRRFGLVIESAQLACELRAALDNAGAAEAFQMAASAAPFEVRAQLEKSQPEVLFVEFSRVPGAPPDWMQTVCSGAGAPVVIALHLEPDPVQMIGALRAGATDFLTLPLNGVAESFERLASQLDARAASSNEKGKLIGMLSAKGGCGATSLACHLAVGLARSQAPGRILITDLDYQSPMTHKTCRLSPRYRTTDAFQAVRRLSSASWPEFVTQVTDGVDLLSGPVAGSAPPEPWRIETLFRFLTTHYSWVLADLGRYLNPASWGFLDNVDELYVVTVPDVLALYQTRCMLQTLTTRGFERSRLRLVLNRNESTPHDFWVESIRQMFEMEVSAAIPNDPGNLRTLPTERYEFPATGPFSKSVMKLAGQMVKSAAAPAKKAA